MGIKEIRPKKTDLPLKEGLPQKEDSANNEELNKDALNRNIYISACHIPWANQAFEEHLLKNGPQKTALYLWQNQRTVVIGRHQNALAEVNLSLLQAEGGYLARRISGGGAVYHDLGNLNFTFVMPKKAYDLHRQTKVILEAVKSLGLDAAFSGRNDLEINGRKFSGNAFYLGRERAFHHGTVLVNCNLEDMLRYLSPSFDKISSKGVASVKARVVNLAELSPGLNTEDIIQSLCRAFTKEYFPGEAEYKAEYIDTQKKAPEILLKKYSSWDWAAGKDPAFEIKLKEKFAWGSFELCLKAKNGFITQCGIYSDALDSIFIERLLAILPGLPLEGNTLARAAESLSGSFRQRNMQEDLGNWLRKIFLHC